MEPPRVVNLVDEPGKVRRDVLESLVGHQVHRLDLKRLHEALRLGIVIRVAASAHRSNKPVCGEDLPAGFAGVLGGFTWSSQQGLSVLSGGTGPEPRQVLSSPGSVAACC